MTNYREASTRQFEIAGTKVITAATLELSDDHPLKSKNYVPLLPNWCVCVTEPCHCTTPDGPIVWVPEDAIRSRKEAGRSNRSGEPLYDFHLENDVTVIQETLIRTKVNYLPILRKIGGSRRRQNAEPTTARAGGFSYEGQHCHDDGILYDSWVETDGSGHQTHHCWPVGSCA